jgi:hypothetical protein
MKAIAPRPIASGTHGERRSVDVGEEPVRVGVDDDGSDGSGASRWTITAVVGARTEGPRANRRTIPRPARNTPVGYPATRAQSTPVSR